MIARDTQRTSAALISVVIACRDAEASIEANVASILAAASRVRHRQVEVIYVDDHSTDRTVALLSHHPVRVIHSPGRGVSAARQEGVRRACGSIIAFTDSDTVVSSGWLEALVKPFVNPHIVGAAGITRILPGTSLASRVRSTERDLRNERILSSPMPWQGWAHGTNAAYRAEALRAAGGFSPAWYHAEDHEVGLLLSEGKGRIALARHALVTHQPEEGLLRLLANRLRNARASARVYAGDASRVGRDHYFSSTRLQAALLLSVLLCILLAACGQTAQWSWLLLCIAGVLLLAYALSYRQLLRRIPARPCQLPAALGICALKDTAIVLGTFTGLLLWLLSYPACKRTLDALSSALLLLLLSPLLLFISIAVIVDSGWPVLYMQERLGLRGKIFRIHKFRTMPPGSEPDGPVWRTERDARFTRMGAWLERGNLNELPQLWNILKGDMSFVGPRPERAHFHTLFLARYARWGERLQMRPGLTGLAQVNGFVGDTSISGRLSHDLAYVTRRSLLLDARIIIATIARFFGISVPESITRLRVPDRGLPSHGASARGPARAGRQRDAPRARPRHAQGSEHTTDPGVKILRRSPRRNAKRGRGRAP